MLLLADQPSVQEVNVPDKARIIFGKEHFSKDEILSFCIEGKNDSCFSLRLNPPDKNGLESYTFEGVQPLLLPLYSSPYNVSDLTGIGITLSIFDNGGIMLENKTGHALSFSKKGFSSRPGILSIQPGCDGIVEGQFQGGTFFGISSVGIGESKYSQNENGLAVNLEDGSIAIGDGIGSCHFSFLISQLAAQKFVMHPGDVKTKVRHAHGVLSLFRRLLSGDLQGDTTFVGLKIHNNLLHSVTLGDSRFYVVRNGKIVACSREHNVAADEFFQRTITEEQMWNHEQKNMLSTSLLTCFEPDYEYFVLDPNGTSWVHCQTPFVLQKGDRVIVCDDGTDALLPDEISSISGIHPKKAVRALLKILQARNVAGEYQRTLVDGTTIRLGAPRDNLSLFIYAHEKLPEEPSDPEDGQLFRLQPSEIRSQNSRSVARLRRWVREQIELLKKR